MGVKKTCVRMEGWRGWRGGRVLQKHRRPAGNCKIKKGWGGSGTVTNITQVCQGATAPGVESLIKDGACLKHWFFIKRHPWVSCRNWGSMAEGGPNMRQVLIWYATIHLILLASSVRCDGTYQIPLICMRPLHEARKIIPSWDGRFSISRYMFSETTRPISKKFIIWSLKKWFRSIFAIIIARINLFFARNSYQVT